MDDTREETLPLVVAGDPMSTSLRDTDGTR